MVPVPEIYGGDCLAACAIMTLVARLAPSTRNTANNHKEAVIQRPLLPANTPVHASYGVTSEKEWDDIPVHARFNPCGRDRCRAG